MNKKKNKLLSNEQISKDKNNKKIKKIYLGNIQKNKDKSNYNQKKKEKRNKEDINKEIKKSKSYISANSKGKEKSESKINNKINKLNKISKDNTKTKNNNLTNNPTKRRINNNKKEEKPLGNKKSKNLKPYNSISINTREIHNNLNKLSFKINETKENLSTNFETITIQGNQSNIKSTKNNDKIKSQLENNLNENIFIDESNDKKTNEENMTTIKRRNKKLGTVLTQIQKYMKKKGLINNHQNYKKLKNINCLKS